MDIFVDGLDAPKGQCIRCTIDPHVAKVWVAGSNNVFRSRGLPFLCIYVTSSVRSPSTMPRRIADTSLAWSRSF